MEEKAAGTARQAAADLQTYAVTPGGLPGQATTVYCQPTGYRHHTGTIQAPKIVSGFMAWSRMTVTH
jgi:hypothetical protein